MSERKTCTVEIEGETWALPEVQPGVLLLDMMEASVPRFGAALMRMILQRPVRSIRVKGVERVLVEWRAFASAEGRFVEVMLRTDLVARPDDYERSPCGGCGKLTPGAVCSAACADMLRAKVEEPREAALMAFVNAVPEGLDPVGWRAAVLAAREYWQQYKDGEWLRPTRMAGLRYWMHAWVKGLYVPPEKSCLEAMVNAYRRAIAPVPKVEPERRRASSAALLLDIDHELAGLAAGVR